MYPCVERLLKMYDAFKSYFISEKNVPLVLRNFFKNDESYFWLLFIEPTLQLFHDTLQSIQGTDLTRIEISSFYFSLMKQIQSPLEAEFIPFTAHNTLRTQVFTLTEPGVKAVAKTFYYSVVTYMEESSTRLISGDEYKIFFLNEEIN